MKYVYSMAETTRYEFPTHINDLVIDRAESVTSEVIVVVIEPGKGPPLHRHDDTEQVFYVLAGQGRLEIGGMEEQLACKAGDLVRIPPCMDHRIECLGPDNLVYIGIDCFVNGRPADEPTWETHVHTMCKINGWDFDEVVKNQ